LGSRHPRHREVGRPRDEALLRGAAVAGGSVHDAILRDAAGPAEGVSCSAGPNRQLWLPMVPVLLEQFLAVHRQRSLGRAAAALGLSQPALSKAMRRLEAELGAALFERRAAGVVPTAAGDALAARAAVIVVEAQRARLDVEHARRTGGVILRLGVAPALAPDAMPDAIMRMRARHPGLGFIVREGLYRTLAGEVARGALDLAVCNRPWEGVAPGLAATAVLQECFVVACRAGHPVLARAADRAALLDHPWALPPREGVLWQRLVDLFLRAGLEPPVPAVETDSVQVLRGLLARAGFLSFLPRRLLTGELVEAPVPGFTLPRELVALHRIGVPPSPVQEAFLAVLAEVASGRG
jgi:DNA-binding transcriptional LysR family regulator